MNIKYYLKKPKQILMKMMRVGVCNWMSDKTYLKLYWYLKFRKKLNLDNPQTFNEKVQWLKLHDRRPEYTTMVDKYEAKKYVADRIGYDYIIPTLGVWDDFDDIDFDALPNQFVLKCTHDSGGLVICRDKSKLDNNAAKKKINRSLRTRYYLKGREWPYKNVKPRIIAEKFMTDQSGGESMSSSVHEGLTDYKFYCFNGEPKFLYISKGLENHATARISFLTLDWQFAPYKRSDYKPFDELPEKPSQYEKMLELASNLSANITFLRVDLYQIGGQVFFSEMTFSPCGGMLPFEPINSDLEIGKFLSIDTKISLMQ